MNLEYHNIINSKCACRPPPRRWKPLLEGTLTTHQVLPLDALDELLVEPGGQLGRHVERLLDGHPQLVVHLLKQARIAVLSCVPSKRGRETVR